MVTSHAAALARLRASMPRQTRKARKRSIGAKPVFVFASMTAHSVTVPLKLVGPNVSYRQHWRYEQRRAKEQRAVVTNALAARIVARPGLPIVVTITRIGPRAMDGDNAIVSCKHVRDGVAKWLGIDDADPRVTWAYAQERGAPRTYGCRIEWRRG